LESIDIVIAGGGPVGSLLAQALAPLVASGTSILQAGVMPAPTHLPAHVPQPRADDRPIAISHGSRLILDRLGLWQGLPATPITSIHVSQRRGFGRTLISAADHGVDALGHVIGYRDLVTALPCPDAVAQRPGRVADWHVDGDGVSTRIGDTTLRARLLVIADGGTDSQDGKKDGEDRVKDYGQSAIVCKVSTETSHHNMAWERFTPEGPVALLPFRDAHALVWTLPAARAEQMLTLGESEFLSALQEAFGNRLGRILDAGPRALFPLTLRVRRKPAAERVIAIGNAAQTLHPVAGQGLNLGFRDAWELAEMCKRCVDESPATLGDAAFVRRFEARRRTDRAAMVRITDGLIAAFSANLPFSSAFRGAALAFLDTVPPARRFLSRRMMFGARALP
jgi:2-octaprenyl-6-methoxyphenol hydroxylase